MNGNLLAVGSIENFRNCNWNVNKSDLIHKGALHGCNAPLILRTSDIQFEKFNCIIIENIFNFFAAQLQ